MNADPPAPHDAAAWSDDWEEGWYAPARRCPSPNFGPRPAGVSIDLAVVHSISLPPGVYGGDAQLVAPADGEGEPMAFKGAVGLEDHVGRRVVGGLVHRVRAVAVL